MPTPAVPIYFDWQFWSAVAALFAIVLSQFPPVHLWLRPRRLDVEVHSGVSITHKVGNPNVQLYVSVRNTGGRELRIRGAKMNVTRDGVAVATLPAQSYFEAPSSMSPVLFVPYSLKPGETWAHTTNFLQLFDRRVEKHFRECKSALESDIRAKLQVRPEGSKELAMADPELVAPFLELFRRMNVWVPGEYVIELVVTADAASASFTKKYRFTLFESDAEDLRSHVDDYRSGGGISYKIERHGGLIVPLSPHTA